MNQVLILTRNILAEQEIQRKLQSLNYEVYSSTKIFDYCNERRKGLDVLHFFQYIILSESICESEVDALSPVLKTYSDHIIRKVENEETVKKADYYKQGLVSGVIATSDSMDEIRERLFHLKTASRTGTANQKMITEAKGTIGKKPYIDKREIRSIVHRLSKNELKVLSVLMQSEDRVVTRDEMCQKVWGEAISSSKLASLSSITSRLKMKFSKVNLGQSAIQTFWGRGYQLDLNLLELLKSEDWLLKQVDF
ncbi:helix-turn-helix domain-containing protein [Enterococcus sp. AZ196]|uniref:helix-turn-helix domain-containing protein n=1 Tax=Enterococcus sp. AZ196 TaxID=2774659 RepID=UPI003D2BC174